MIRHFKTTIVTIGLFLLSLSTYASSVSDLLHHPNDPVVGNPNGTVTVVEFFDYQCSYCASMSNVMNRLIHANPKVRFVFKDFPITGPMSRVAAKAALAANKQGKYYRFNRALFTTGDVITQEEIDALAARVGLNVKTFHKDMNSSNINNQLRNNIQLAQSLNVSGTPYFFVGKTNAKSLQNLEIVSGAMSYSELQNAINQAGRS